MKIKIIGNRHFEILFQKKINKILLIGNVDTGKTTLLKEIARKFIFYSIPVTIIDCDIGQSFIGPPTTISLIKLKKNVYNFFPFPDRFYFTGAISPSSNIIGFLTGIEKIEEVCKKEKNEKILIDTTGYIKDKIAREIKIHKIEVFSPDLVLLLEKKDELFFVRNFLRYSKIKFLTIKIPENFPVKTITEREENRSEKFRRYFRITDKIKININNISIKKINLHEEISLNNPDGLLISLRDRNLNDRVLGVISKKERDFLEVFYPKGKIDFEVKGIAISNIKIDF